MFTSTQILFTTLILTSSAFPIVEIVIGGCESTEFGCCPHQLTVACTDLDCMNCVQTNTTLLGGCESTEFGCCLDNQTVCLDTICSNCYAHTVMIGGCNGTLYGCCDDLLTPCSNQNCTGCPIKI